MTEDQRREEFMGALGATILALRVERGPALGIYTQGELGTAISGPGGLSAATGRLVNSAGPSIKVAKATQGLLDGAIDLPLHIGEDLLGDRRFHDALQATLRYARAPPGLHCWSCPCHLYRRRAAASLRQHPWLSSGGRSRT